MTLTRPNKTDRRKHTLKIQKMNKLQIFIMSFVSYLELYSAGFRITKSSSQATFIDLITYRFWWKEKIIAVACDIDKVNSHFRTVSQSSVKKLD